MYLYAVPQASQILVRGAAGLPDLALVALTVAHRAEHAVVFAVELCGERHADRTGQALAERAGGDVDAGALVHAGVALQGGALLAQCVQDFHREEALHCERGVLGGADMALREHEAVAVGPAGFLGPDIHVTEIAGGHKIRHGQRAARMPALGLIDHGDDMLFQIYTGVLQVPDAESFFHGNAPFLRSAGLWERLLNLCRLFNVHCSPMGNFIIV